MCSDIKGYEGLYKIFDSGVVWSERKQKMLTNNKNRDGYSYVTLIKNKKRNNHYVHRLVASHFIPNPNDKREVNHINGIKTDNRKQNLEWCTRSENMLHAIRRLGISRLRGEQNNKSKLNEDIVRKMRKSNESNRYWADLMGMDISSIRMARNGSNWSHVK